MKFLVSLIMLGALVGFSGCAPKSFTNNNEADETTTGVIGGSLIFERNTTASRSVVYIEFLNKFGNEISFCTATLIDKNTVLTAAHCFDQELVAAKAFNVVFELNVGQENPRVSRPGYKYKSHPDYNSRNASGEKRRFSNRKEPAAYDHDIAIASFTGDLPEGFAPVDYDTNEDADYSGALIYVFGYGRRKDYVGDRTDFERGPSTGSLAKGIMMVNHDYDRYEDHYLTLPTSENFLCQGDSGGPQFYIEGQKVKVIGVNSASLGPTLGNGRRKCSQYSQGTKVAPFSDWIKKQMKKIAP